MRLNSLKVHKKSALKGLFTPLIPYEVRNQTGDWSPWFGAWEGQKHGDLDTNCCWCFAGCECVDDQLMFLWKTGTFSPDDIQWFKDKGYIDPDGDFYISRRFIAILSGVRDNGNDEADFWRLFAINGIVPNSSLPFTNNESYFDRAAITDDLAILGREFLGRVSVASEELGKRFSIRSVDTIKSALLQSPLQIGIPVPQDGTWNQNKIKWNGDKTPEHSVELYKYDPVADPDFPYFIYDQYVPAKKQLSKDYYIPIITKGIISPVILSPKLSVSVWVRFVAILRQLGIVV